MVRITTNRWHPDTCNCVVDFEFDADLDGDSQVHTGKNIVKDCPDHSGLTDPVTFHAAILDENQRKNKVRQDLMDSFPDITELDGDGQIEIKKGIVISWTWQGINADRVLHVTVTGYTLTTQNKTTIQGIADSKYGVGKVVID